MKLFLFLFLVPFSVYATCQSAYQDKRLDRSALKAAYERGERDFCKANLRGEDLSNMNLSKVNLSGAKLNKVNLTGSDLSQANLKDVNLSRSTLHKTFFLSAHLENALLQGADIQGAIFDEAKLKGARLARVKAANASFARAKLDGASLLLMQGANINFLAATLVEADLTGCQCPQANLSQVKANNADFTEARIAQSSFEGADLTEAVFTQADLTGVDLTDATLDFANFQFANFEDVIYMPSLMGHPELGTFSTVKQFDKVRFYDAERGLPAMTSLQIALKKAGIRSMERLVTSMVKEQQMNQAFERGGLSTIEGVFNYVLFYVPTRFGLEPGRALWMYLVLTMVLTPLYYFSLGSRSPYAGIVINWTSRRDSSHHYEAAYQHFIKLHEADPIIERLIKRYRMICTAIYFSFISSLSIGWQDFNLANWITKTQTRNYHLKPRGWVRSLAGCQAIVSAYLIVIWALTYFGRPFEW